MQITAALLLLALSSASAFTPLRIARPVKLTVVRSDKEDLGFTPWKPQGQGEYRATDTPDFFEEGATGTSEEVGSKMGQTASYRNSLEDALKTDSWTIGGAERPTGMPSWFKTTRSEAPDGVLDFNTSGASVEVTIENNAMGYEDFYAGLADGTPADSFEIEPLSGVLERRGGEPTVFTVKYRGAASGIAGQFIVQTEEDRWVYDLKVPN